MSDVRGIRLARAGRPTMDGAGVHLRRAFGNGDVRDLDPFLLLDDFRSRNPADFMAGFPWHPHRGIETITYVLEGVVEHQDSLDNSGLLGAGDVQWMTAGSGILHQEMPKVGPTRALEGFQLWANLPAADKLMDPRYQDVAAASAPVVSLDGSTVRVIAGEVGGVVGPVEDIVIEPEYFDVTIPPASEFEHVVKRSHTVAAYVFEGSADFSGSHEEFGDGTLVVFGEGEKVRVRTGDRQVRFIMFSGRPLREPIAWGGPIVMNTKAELQRAYEDLDNGVFVKRRGQVG